MDAEIVKTIAVSLVGATSAIVPAYFVFRAKLIEMNKYNEARKEEIKLHVDEALVSLRNDPKAYIAQFVASSRKEVLVNKWLAALLKQYKAHHAWIGFFHNGVLMSNNDHLIKVTAHYEWPPDFKNQFNELLSVRTALIETPISSMGDYSNLLLKDAWHHLKSETVNNPIMANEFERWELVENLNVMLYHDGEPVAVLGLNWRDNEGITFDRRKGCKNIQEAMQKLRSGQDGLVSILLEQ